MIRSIYEFKSILNEVRIPAGAFHVNANFMLPSKDGWDTVFNKGDIIKIIPTERKIEKWNTLTQKWTIKDVDWIRFMMPEFYSNFKNNSSRVDPGMMNVPPGLESPKDEIEFTTTVKAFPRRAANLGLEDSDKIKVKVLESIQQSIDPSPKYLTDEAAKAAGMWFELMVDNKKYFDKMLNKLKENLDAMDDGERRDHFDDILYQLYVKGPFYTPDDKLPADFKRSYEFTQEQINAKNQFDMCIWDYIEEAIERLLKSENILEC